MNQEEIKKTAKRLLEENSNISELYATADGNLFADAKKASLHNSRCVKKEVVTYNRKSFPKPKVTDNTPAQE